MLRNTRARTPEMEADQRRRDRSVLEDAGRYLRARLILNDLREKYLAGKITFQQYSTLRGQALAGDVDGAVKGLARVLRQNEVERLRL